ncbi:MAG: hypothetical protein KDK90_04350 [Leptospiraceae bacterium]|nr:hypothetical protein [Leptospiraceae bacterium]
MIENIEQGLQAVLKDLLPTQSLSLLLKLQQGILSDKEHLKHFGGILRNSKEKEEFLLVLMDVLETSSSLVAEFTIEDFKRKGFLQNDQLKHLLDSLTKFLQGPISEIFHKLNHELTTVEEKQKILVGLAKLKEDLEREAEEIRTIRSDTDTKSKELAQLREHKARLAQDLNNIKREIEILEKETAEQTNTLDKRRTFFEQRKKDAEHYPEYLEKINNEINTFQRELGNRWEILEAIPNMHQLRDAIQHHLQEAEKAKEELEKVYKSTTDKYR